jgi:hypothetical protein
MDFEKIKLCEGCNGKVNRKHYCNGLGNESEILEIENSLVLDNEIKEFITKLLVKENLRARAFLLENKSKDNWKGCYCDKKKLITLHVKDHQCYDCETSDIHGNVVPKPNSRNEEILFLIIHEYAHHLQKKNNCKVDEFEANEFAMVCLGKEIKNSLVYSFKKALFVLCFRDKSILSNTNIEGISNAFRRNENK